MDSIKVFRPNDEQLVYLGIVGFNQELYEKPINILAKSTSNFFRSYVNDLSTKAGTLLYYAVDNAIDKLSQYDFKTPISNVAIITFTDGLDQGSLMMNSNYSTNEQYLNAIQQRIANTKVKGLPLIAYSVGLRGGDVSDYNQFQANLQKLASSADKAFEVNNMNDVNSRLKEISDRIISISNKQTVSMKIPGQSNGTLIRFTFDGMLPDESEMYIEGTFNLADRSLRNVSYHGIKALGNNYIQGTQDGIFVTFTFSGLQREDENGLIPTTNICQYTRSTGSDIWQRNSEFTPNNNILTTITHSGAVVMLVLDCSSSLGSQFGNLQSYAQSFINQLANNTADFNVSTPTNVKAEINDDDFSVRVSWDVAKHAQSYDVYRSGSGTSGFNRVANEITATTWIDTSPLSGKNYYRVYAIGYGLTSLASNSSNVVDYRLEVPQNVKGNMLVENGKLVIMVNWDASRHAESYNVYRSSSPSGGFTRIASNVSSLSWSDTSPLSGNNYYQVEALGHGTTSPLSNATKVVSYSLDAPKNANASLDDDRFVIVVNWDSVDFAESYSVYRSNGASFSLVAKDVLETNWTDESPLAGNNYYKVYAEGYGLVSQASETTNNVVYELDAPQNVTATLDNTLFVIRVQWDAVKHAEGYDVYRSSNSSNGFTKVAEGVTSTSWSDENPLSGNNYYRVYAVGHGLTSSAGNTSVYIKPACPDTHHPHEIDLGLPSGTKWACSNVGATTPEEYGGYYAWGETEEKGVYSKDTYKFRNYSSDISGTKYDVAHVKWGGEWVMPTKDEFKELLDNCNSKWTTLNGVKGRKFTSKKNGNSIFLPAAGDRAGGNLYSPGERGYYWSSVPSPYGSSVPYILSFKSDEAFWNDGIVNYYGLSVRPVVRK